jgi:nicotinate phosphoribosyltransferase
LAAANRRFRADLAELPEAARRIRDPEPCLPERSAKLAKLARAVEARVARTGVMGC